jgi:hypothetical protein
MQPIEELPSIMTIRAHIIACRRRLRVFYSEIAGTETG